MPREKRPCVVCATAAASYACPRCRAPYCSVACCKQHKGDCRGPAGAPRQQARRSGGGGGGGVAPPRGEARHADAGECDDERNVLSEEHKRRLSGCAWLRDELRSEATLRELLVRIERAADPKAALATARSNDPRFAALVDHMLIELGICSRDAEGGVTFHGAKEPLPPPGRGRPPRPLYHPVSETEREQANRALAGVISRPA